RKMDGASEPDIFSLQSQKPVLSPLTNRQDSPSFGGGLMSVFLTKYEMEPNPSSTNRLNIT
ncbi:hypothetical protein OAU25_01710, partial [Crocinitomicaceae bacterium]|nr:hypothetical protein [Crocinitomicaceae bacterium]